MGSDSAARKSPAVRASQKTGPGDRVRESRRGYPSRTLEQRAETIRPKGQKTPLKYVVVFERTRSNYGAYVPDLPGCVATGKTRDQVVARIREAIAFHIEGMNEGGLPVPEPTAWADLVEVA